MITIGISLTCLSVEVTFAPSQTIATKNIFVKVDDNSDGTSSMFSTTRQEVQLCWTAVKYIARLGHYLHKYVEGFHEANCSCRSDLNKAITEKSKLLNFCACL